MSGLEQLDPGARTFTETALDQAMNEIERGEMGYLDVATTRLLRERVSSAFDNVPFYRHLYDGFGRPPGEDGSFLRWFESLPIVDKGQLHAAGRQALLNPQHPPAFLVDRPTSGSTGIPFVLVLDPRVLNFRKWRFQRPHRQVSGAGPSKLVYLFPWNFAVQNPRKEAQSARSQLQGDGAPDPSDAQGGPAPLRRSGAERAGQPNTEAQARRPTRFVASLKRQRRMREDEPGSTEGLVVDEDRPVTVNAFLEPAELFETLEALEPCTLVGFASTIAALAQWLNAEGQHLPSVRHVWTTSEVLSITGGDQIRKAWGCEPLSIYASNEFGFMAWQPGAGQPLIFESDRLHVEAMALHEPRRAAPGEPCRIVLTDLLNDTMPLIRYDISDLACAAKPVEVLPRLTCVAMSGMQGKEADQINPPDGRTVTTFEVLGTIKDHLPHTQYRVVVLDRARYVVQYVPGPGFAASTIQDTMRALLEVLGEEVEISFQQVERLAREASGKLRPLVNLASLPEPSRTGLARRLGLSEAVGFSATSLVHGLLCHVLPSYTADALPKGSLELYADLGMSSIHFVELISRLEQQLEREVSDEDLLDAEIITIDDLVCFIKRLLSR
ncbi:MAG TPA: phosphopantetheine-binding protein [Kofleriaceae bacterium]